MKKGKKFNIGCLEGLSNVEISEKIRDFFTEICTKHPPLDPSKLPTFLPANDDLPNIDRMDVYRELIRLKPSKASPPGELPTRLFKEFAYELSLPLTHIFNLSLRNGMFPDRWKEATITPLPKKKLVSELGDLRPVSLTPILGKILEGMVTQVMLKDIRANLDPRQYGNLKGSSTAHYLIYLLDTIHQALDKPHHMASLVLVDFKKAFDFVDHSIAITELISLGCRASIIPFISDFLTGRRHRVRYKDAVSDPAPITCGVPQGTRAGCVIFLALVNSLCKGMANRAKYVDDLTMAHLTKILEEIVFVIQQDLDTLATECHDKGMETNPVKCEVMHTIFPLRPITLPDLTLNGVPLPVVHEVKLLGVHLNDRLTWTTHVDHVLNTARKRFYILYQAKKFRFCDKSHDHVPVVHSHSYGVRCTSVAPWPHRTATPAAGEGAQAVPTHRLRAPLREL